MYSITYHDTITDTMHHNIEASEHQITDLLQRGYIILQAKPQNTTESSTYDGPIQLKQSTLPL